MDGVVLSPRVPLIGGKHGVIFFGPRDNPFRDRFWAARGMIHIEHSDDNTYECISVREFLQRLRGIGDIIGNGVASAPEGYAHWDEIHRQQRFVEEAADLARKAQEQGMPPRLGTGKLMHQRFTAVVKPRAKQCF